MAGTNPPPAVPVGKTYVTNDSGSFLIESVNYASVASQLQALPTCNQGGGSSQWNIKKSDSLYASLPKLRHPLPGARASLLSYSQKRMALDTTSPKFIVDYVTVESGTNNSNTFVFTNNQTFLISDVFYCGEGVIFESNAVIKYPAAYGSADPHIEAAEMTCNNSPDHPTIFTASDDNSYGATVTTNQDPHYTGSVSGNYGGTAYLYSGFNNQYTIGLNNAVMLYAGAACSTANCDLANVQISQCGVGFLYAESVFLSNCIIGNVSCVSVNAGPILEGGSCTYFYLNFCTMDSIGTLEANNPNCYLTDCCSDTFYATNCVFTANSDTWSAYNTYGDFNGFDDTNNFFGSDTTFDTNGYAGSGSNAYHLATNSAFIDAGSMPAVSLGFYHYTTQTNQAPETNTMVDLGYHYLALDTNGNPIDSSASGVPDYILAPYGPVLPYGTGYITNGLVAYWKLDDGTGTNAADSSTNGYTMALSNAPDWGGTNYLILNGTNQYGNAGTNPAAFNYQNFSVSAWINKNSTSFKAIVDKSVDNTFGGMFEAGGWGFWINDSGNLILWGGGTPTSEDVDTTSLASMTGDWVMVTAVYYDNGPTTLTDFYINGLYSSGAGTVIYPQHSDGYANLQVGNIGSDTNLPAGNYLFDGAICQVGIYNRALSSNEVTTNFLLTSGRFTNDLVPYPDLLYYKMADYSASNATAAKFTIYDSSIHAGTTGTYSNASETWVTNNVGLPNTALHFGGTGSDGLDTSNSTLFNFTTNLFSVNFWVDPYGTLSGYTLMQNGTTSSNGWYIFLKPDFTIAFGTETNGHDEKIITPIAVANSNYTMVTVVRNSSNTASIYLNGVLSTNDSCISPVSSTNEFRIGSDLTSSSIMDGNIWMVQIWSTPLRPTDVANLYLHQINGTPWP